MPTAWTFGRRRARWYAVLFWGAFAVAALPALARAGEPDSKRQGEILHLLKHDCGSCHGMTLRGGLGPSLRPDVLGERSDDLLIETILNGRRGTPMAPWRISLNEDEARWLVTILKEGIDGAD
ncbi:MAG: cytochrome c [Alphaproteobacteria bacterium]